MIKEFIIILYFAAFALAQNQCSNYWQYVRVQNEIQGILTLSHNQLNTEHRLKIIITVGAKLPTTYVGDISLMKDRQKAFEDVKNGYPIQYRIRFPLQAPLAKLMAVYYNNQLMCVGQKESGAIVTTITLEHSLYSKLPTQNLQNNQYYPTYQKIPNSQNTQNEQNFQSTHSPQNFQQNTQSSQINQYSKNFQNNPPKTQQYSGQDNQIYQTSQTKQFYQTSPNPINSQNIQYNQNENYPESARNNQIYQNSYTTAQPTATSPRIDQSVLYNKVSSIRKSTFQCGVPHQKLAKHTGLIINGRAALKGQFPWLASYFHNGGDFNAFICGGSLVSEKAVITAAHCIHEKRSVQRSAEEALFYIGKHMIKVYGDEKDFIIAPARKFIVHPSWNPKSDSFDGDIAIVILSRTVRFTSSIQPICLWSATSNYHDIVDNYGVIAGYGKTEFSVSSSDIPYWTAVPVVDEGTCLRSNQGFTKITSTRTFCVGSRDGRGPCNGDSGGGFIIEKDGKSYLRGILSSSLFDGELQTCDTRNYAVCTDVAAFHSWIMQNI